LRSWQMLALEAQSRQRRLLRHHASASHKRVHRGLVAWHVVARQSIGVRDGARRVSARRAWRVQQGYVRAWISWASRQQVRAHVCRMRARRWPCNVWLELIWQVLAGAHAHVVRTRHHVCATKAFELWHKVARHRVWHRCICRNLHAARERRYIRGILQRWVDYRRWRKGLHAFRTALQQRHNSRTQMVVLAMWQKVRHRSKRQRRLVVCCRARYHRHIGRVCMEHWCVTIANDTLGAPAVLQL
jgi:hypothetical protein